MCCSLTLPIYICKPSCLRFKSFFPQFRVIDRWRYKGGVRMALHKSWVETALFVGQRRRRRQEDCHFLSLFAKGVLHMNMIIYDFMLIIFVVCCLCFMLYLSLFGYRKWRWSYGIWIQSKRFCQYSQDIYIYFF